MGNTVTKKISDLRHRVALCTMKDVVLNGSTMVLKREAVTWCWAAFENYVGRPSFISPMGYAIRDPVETVTHAVFVRAALGIDFTSAAWVYEERRQLIPRWLKVLGFAELGPWVQLSAHLVERSAAVLPPDSALAPMPMGVEL